MSEEPVEYESWGGGRGGKGEGKGGQGGRSRGKKRRGRKGRVRGFESVVGFKKMPVIHGRDMGETWEYMGRRQKKGRV